MNNENIKTTSRAEILAKYKTLISKSPTKRARDIAHELSISEAELLNSRTSEELIKLSGDWAALIRSLPCLGTVMALTRNENCVHEKHGQYGNITIGPGHGIVLNKNIDLRLFMSHWHFGFAVSEYVTSGKRYSLQFFDIDGQAVHKIYIPKNAKLDSYEALVNRYRSSNQHEDLLTHSLPKQKPDLPDEELDVDNFLNHWSKLQDTHHFFGLLHDFGISRRQSMRLARGRFTRQVPDNCLEGVLNSAVTAKLSIMCFVGNPGCIQIHTGKIYTTTVMGNWVNILDKDFNLHLNQRSIESIWAVEKPTSDGIVTSLEIYDHTGLCFCQFFGERKPGKKELPDWQKIVSSIPIT